MKQWLKMSLGIRLVTLQFIWFKKIEVVNCISGVHALEKFSKHVTNGLCINGGIVMKSLCANKNSNVKTLYIC